MSRLSSFKQFFKNPIHTKEFRERFRAPKTIWIISIYLFVIGGILLGFMGISLAEQAFVPGENREYFIVFSVLLLVMIGFMAPGLSAGVISGERERQTLNILLTTHLSPMTIVLSKLLTSLAFIGLLILMSIPLYSFIFLFGGVSPTEVFHVFLFYSVNIIFFGCLGLFCSTLVKRTGISTVMAYGFTFFIAVGTGIIAIFLHEWFYYLERAPENHALIFFITSLNPFVAIMDIFDPSFYNSEYIKIRPWVLYSFAYGALSVILIFVSAYLLKPVRKLKINNAQSS